MHSPRHLVAFAAAAFLFALPSTVAAAGLVLPADGSVATINAKGEMGNLVWTLAPNERVRDINVSKNPPVDGRVADDDWISLKEGDTSYVPSKFIPEIGKRYWQLVTVSPDANGDDQETLSPVWSFTVPWWFGLYVLDGHKGIEVVREEGSSDISWMYYGNANRRVVSSVLVKYGKRVVGRYKSAEYTNSSTAGDSFTWTRPKTVPRAKRLTTILALTSGKVTKRYSRTFFSS